MTTVAELLVLLSTEYAEERQPVTRRLSRR